MVSILIVEDEICIAEMYEMLLELNGHEVVGKASNGEIGVQLYKQLEQKPDIVIMDYRMPLKDGIEASKEILEYDQNARIIFASADVSVKKHAKKIGVKSFKTKPFDNERLIRNIEKAMNKMESKLTS